MSFYVAGKLTNIETVRKVIERCREIGEWGALTYDWTVHGSIMGQGEEAYRALAQVELDAVLKANFVFVVLPGGRGTHVELGAALATDKKIVLLIDKDEDLIQDRYTTIFYYHQRVEWKLLTTFLGGLR